MKRQIVKGDKVLFEGKECIIDHIWVHGCGTWYDLEETKTFWGNYRKHLSVESKDIVLITPI